MGLADLKKKPTSIEAKLNKSVSIDDFINDAQRYASGQAELALSGGCALPRDIELSHLKSSRQLSQNQLHELSRSNKPIFKHATFSLSEAAIVQLSTMALKKNMAKSKLLRQLIYKEFMLENN